MSKKERLKGFERTYFERSYFCICLTNICENVGCGRSENFFSEMF